MSMMNMGGNGGSQWDLPHQLQFRENGSYPSTHPAAAATTATTTAAMTGVLPTGGAGGGIRNSVLRGAVCRSVMGHFEGNSRLVRHSGCVNTLHFSSDGSLLLSGSDDQSIIIWDYPTIMAASLTANSSYIRGSSNTSNTSAGGGGIPSLLPAFRDGLQGGKIPGIIRHKFNSGHRGNVFQAKTMPFTVSKKKERNWAG